MSSKQQVAILGAGLTGCCAALSLAQRGFQVTLFDKQLVPVRGASLHNEGKLHLGYVYGADPEAETHEIMVRGSLSFVGIIERLTGVERELFRQSSPFIYGVPADSQLSFRQQCDHFQRVDQCIEERHRANYGGYCGAMPEPSRPQSQADYERTFDVSIMQGGLQTGEYSLDTRYVSYVIGASLMAHSNIRLVSEAEVLSCQQNSEGDYSVEFAHQGQSTSEDHYAGVINCLWEDRIRIDKTVGIEPPRPWLVRYKAAISGELPHAKSGLPSVTLITGPYGDLVNHGNGHFYLSWYPKCKLGESRDDHYPDIEHSLNNLNTGKLIKDSIAGMARYIPDAGSVLAKARDIQVGGGYIFAWGQSDITDPGSGLHQRHLIGPEAHDRWVTVNTGKYCTAPLFGLDAADQLIEQLG